MPFLCRGSGTALWDHRTLRPPARTVRQYCERLASIGSGAYRHPAGRRRRRKSAACACAAPDCRDEADNTLPRGSHAWPIGRSDVSDRESTGRPPPNAAWRPGVQRTASVTVDAFRASRSLRRGNLRSYRAVARRNPISGLPVCAELSL